MKEKQINMENREAKLKEYAKLLIEIGLNVQKGQTVKIACSVENAYFARMCASAAYDAGCREVVMDWSDPLLAREKYLRADDAIFDEFPEWRTRFLTGLAEGGAASLSIGGNDPELMRGVDPGRMTRVARAAEKPLEKYRQLLMSNTVPWCVASIPMPAWAKKVFPGIPENEAMEKLWEAIFASVRVVLQHPVR